MSLGVSGAAIPAIEGSAALQRWQEWIADPQYNVGSIDTAYAGFAYSRSLHAAWAAGNIAAVWVTFGNQAPVFRVVNDEHVLDVFAIAGAIGAQECGMTFSPVTNFGVDFKRVQPTLLEASPGVPAGLAGNVSAWIRKKAAGDATHCAQFVGFVNGGGGDFNRSTRVARIGLMGDGALGFRFGSVNCPDAPLGGADNGATNIDANSVQPAVLVNPGASWLHVRIKLVPATEFQTGRFACYLNGRLAATFTLAANMPRTSRSSIDVSAGPFHLVKPCFAMWGAGGAAPGPGYYLRDLRVRLEEDLRV